MDQSKIRILAVFLIIGSLAAGGAYYWGTTTIIADTTPPVINEAATTHGAISYANGKPTLLLFVDENIGIESAEVEIKTKGGLLGYGSKTVETLDMTLTQKMDQDTYKYKATCTKQLEQNTEYTVIYRVYDQAGNGDPWTTSIETVNLDGVVRVNGVTVEDPEDTIYSKSLDIGIEVEITQGENTVNRIYGVVNGKTLEFSQSPSGIWISSYTLPEDGKYSFLIQVLDTSGTDTQLASFNIQLGNDYQREILVAVVALIAAALLYNYVNKQPEKKEGGAKK